MFGLDSFYLTLKITTALQSKHLYSLRLGYLWVLNIFKSLLRGADDSKQVREGVSENGREVMFLGEPGSSLPAMIKL